MSSPSPAIRREQMFSRLFHATAEKCWPGMARGPDLLDAEGRAFLAEIGFSEGDFFGLIDDYVAVSGDVLTWWHRAAEDGSVGAQVQLGYFYTNGIGVTCDYAQARYWYEKAARKGVATAQSGLGYLYANGLGVARDYVQALTWYRKAAEQGNAAAQSGLGYLYGSGFGTERDEGQAAYWHRLAAEQGSAYSQAQYAGHCLRGRGVRRMRQRRSAGCAKRRRRAMPRRGRSCGGWAGWIRPKADPARLTPRRNSRCASGRGLNRRRGFPAEVFPDEEEVADEGE